MKVMKQNLNLFISSVETGVLGVDHASLAIPGYPSNIVAESFYASLAISHQLSRTLTQTKSCLVFLACVDTEITDSAMPSALGISHQFTKNILNHTNYTVSLTLAQPYLSPQPCKVSLYKHISLVFQANIGITQCLYSDRLVIQLCLHIWSGGTPVLLA